MLVKRFEGLKRLRIDLLVKFCTCLDVMTTFLSGGLPTSQVFRATNIESFVRTVLDQYIVSSLADLRRNLVTSSQCK